MFAAAFSRIKPPPFSQSSFSRLKAQHYSLLNAEIMIGGSKIHHFKGNKPAKK